MNQNFLDGMSICLTTFDGCHPFEKNKGFFMITCHKTPLGYSGITLEESEDRSMAYLTLSAPGVRHDTKYTNNDNSTPGGRYSTQFLRR